MLDSIWSIETMSGTISVWVSEESEEGCRGDGNPTGHVCMDVGNEADPLFAFTCMSSGSGTIALTESKRADDGR